MCDTLEKYDETAKEELQNNPNVDFLQFISEHIKRDNEVIKRLKLKGIKGIYIDYFGDFENRLVVWDYNEKANSV